MSRDGRVSAIKAIARRVKAPFLEDLRAEDANGILDFHSVESDSFERIHARERRAVAPLSALMTGAPPPSALCLQNPFQRFPVHREGL